MKYYYREEDWYPVYQLMPPNEVAPYIEMTEEEMHAYLTAKDTLALELQKFNKKLQKQAKEIKEKQELEQAQRMDKLRKEWYKEKMRRGE
jgi:hypothetical protein